jgi:hypothetical protein
MRGGKNNAVRECVALVRECNRKTWAAQMREDADKVQENKEGNAMEKGERA